MRQPRIYHPQPLQSGDRITLTDFAYQHAIVVLRQKLGDKLRLFDGSGYDFDAEVVDIQRREASLSIDNRTKVESESPLRSVLLQGISKNDRMDLALQKATELGVTEIIPVRTRRSDSIKQPDKKMSHWQKVIIHACEQSGRSRLPQLHPIASLRNAIESIDCHRRLIMSINHSGDTSADKLPVSKTTSVVLLVGPIAGLTVEEEKLAFDAGYQSLHLGPRVMRTETAAAAGLTYCQIHWGDFRQNFDTKEIDT